MGKNICINRKAWYDYHILETYEAGIELKGCEVKSLRTGRTNLKDSFGRIEKGEVFLYNWHISPYEYGNRYNPDPTRPRKLLLRKEEINRLYGKVAEKGLSLIPLKLYFKKGKAKCELAVARGKRQYDRREDIKRKIADREMERALKNRS